MAQLVERKLNKTALLQRTQTQSKFNDGEKYKQKYFYLVIWFLLFLCVPFF